MEYAAGGELYSLICNGNVKFKHSNKVRRKRSQENIPANHIRTRIFTYTTNCS